MYRCQPPLLVASPKAVLQVPNLHSWWPPQGQSCKCLCLCADPPCASQRAEPSARDGRLCASFLYHVCCGYWMYINRRLPDLREVSLFVY